MMPFDQEDKGQAHYSKLLIREFFKHAMAWPSQTEFYHYSGRASGFMNQHVLYHESVSINPHFIADALINIMTHQQVRLTERVLQLTRRFHPHLEQLISRNGEFRQDLEEIEFSPSWTVSEVSVNPWISSNPMEVDEDVMVSHGESAKTVVMTKQGKIMLKCLMEVTSLDSLDWSQSSTSSS